MIFFAPAPPRWFQRPWYRLVRAWYRLQFAFYRRRWVDIGYIED